MKEEDVVEEPSGSTTSRRELTDERKQLNGRERNQNGMNWNVESKLNNSQAEIEYLLAAEPEEEAIANLNCKTKM